MKKIGKKNLKSLVTQVKDMNGIVMLIVKEITYGEWKVKIMIGITKKIKRLMSVVNQLSVIASIKLN